MAELRINFGDEEWCFAGEPGRVVTVGRSADSDVVVAEPSVSRHHAQVEWDGRVWRWTDIGHARTFRSGVPASGLVVDGATSLSLASPTGPVLGVVAVRHTSGVTEATVPAGTVSCGGVRAGREGISAKDELRAAFEILMPVKSWLHDSGWRQRLRLAVIPYGLLPLAFIALYKNSTDLNAPGWLYSLYVAPLWAFAFWLLIRPGPLSRTHLAVGAGVIAGVWAWMHAVTVNINGSIGQPNNILKALAVGFNEESTKALPILVAAVVLLKWRKEKLSLRMWMFLGSVSGLAFGVIESASVYAPGSITDILNVGITAGKNAGQLSPGDVHVIQNAAVSDVLQFTLRVFVDGFQHAIWAAIACYFVGMAVNYPRRRVELLAFAVSVPAVLHGVNDWISPHSLWLQVGVQAVSLLIFIGYTMSAGSIERQVRHSTLFRGDSVLVDGSRSEPDSQSEPWSAVLAEDVRGLNFHGAKR